MNTKKSIIILLIIHIALFTESTLIWIILFSIIIVQNIRANKTYLLDEINKVDQPMIYWMTIFTWVYIILMMLWNIIYEYTYFTY